VTISTRSTPSGCAARKRWIASSAMRLAFSIGYHMRQSIWKGTHTRAAKFHGESETLLIARGQKFGLSLRLPPTYRSDCVNDVLCLPQAIGLGRFSLPRGAPSQAFAFRQEFRSCRAWIAPSTTTSSRRVLLRHSRSRSRSVSDNRPAEFENEGHGILLLTLVLRILRQALISLHAADPARGKVIMKTSAAGASPGPTRVPQQPAL